MAIHIDAVITSTAARTATIATPNGSLPAPRPGFAGSGAPAPARRSYDRLSLTGLRLARIPRTARACRRRALLDAGVAASGRRPAWARQVRGPGGAAPDSRQQRDDRDADDDVDDGGEDLAGQRRGLGERRGGRDHVGQGGDPGEECEGARRAEQQQ